MLSVAPRMGALTGVTIAIIVGLFAGPAATAVEPPTLNARATSTPAIAPITASADATWEVDTPRIRIKPEPAAPAGIVALARAQLGVPYVWSAESPRVGFDCSGLTWYVYQQVGISIPRTTQGLRHAGKVVTKPRPGDVVWSPGHVGIYVSPGMMIAAPHSGSVVKLQPIYVSHPVYLRFTK